GGQESGAGSAGGRPGGPGRGGARGGGRLGREPTLPRPAGPGDRDEPHVVAREELLDAGEVVLPADETMVERGQRGAAERLEWRGGLFEIRGGELGERLLPRGVLHAGGSERAGRESPRPNDRDDVARPAGGHGPAPRGRAADPR